jgi:hypothetical protein
MLQYLQTSCILGGATLAVLLSSACDRHPEGPRPGTAAMVELLQEIQRQELADVSIREADTAASNPWFINRPQTIPGYRRAANEAKALVPSTNFLLKLLRELLWDGRNAEAMACLRELQDLAQVAASQADAESVARLESILREQAAICFLRIAEQENCVACQNGESCLLPIRSGGVHQKTEGARGAIEVLEESLAVSPGNLAARWLLNLSYMVLGEYPARVSAAYLIPESAFASEYDIKRFPNVARERGVDAFGLAGGCALEDFDGDDDLDIIASGWSLRDQIRYFRNRGDGHFDDQTVAAGLTGEVGGLNMSHADYDNDGRPDVLVLRGGWLGDRGNYPSSLLRNVGGGVFEDVTKQAGILSFAPGQGGVWADFDNDGWLDLFLCREGDGKGRSPCQLFHSNRDGTFTDWAPALGVAHLGFVKGAAWGDYDNDGRQDLYVSRLGEPNLLFRNEGRQGAAPGPESWKLTDVSHRAGIGEPKFSFAAWFFDYDNDGWLDIVACGFNRISPAHIAAQYLNLPNDGEVPRLYRNNQDSTFTDVTRAMRLDRVLSVMGADFGDLDNDGFLDIYFGTGAPDLSVLLPNRMFRNDAGRGFQDVTTSGGFGHLQKGHGIAFGDIDRDGDQDIYAVFGGWYTADGFRRALFENPGHGNHWITLKLEGVQSNRSAIGARIKVTLPATAPHREIHATVGAISSFGGSSLAQEIGLGKAEAIESIEITWPVTGRKQILKGPRVDQFLRVREE